MFRHFVKKVLVEVGKGTHTNSLQHHLVSDLRTKVMTLFTFLQISVYTCNKIQNMKNKTCFGSIKSYFSMQYLIIIF